MNNFNLFRFLPVLIGLVGVASIAGRGCKHGPFGRSQVVTLSPEQEDALGFQSYKQILSKSRVIRDVAAVDHVRRVGRRLAEASMEPEVLKLLQLKPRRFNWEFQVIDSPQVNAFCLPGGKVAVYTGILPVCKTDAGLAVVMGHEIGHALARHGAERMAQNQMVRMGQTAVASSLGGLDYRTQQMVYGMFGAGAQYGLVLPFSRSHESEADRIGLILMAGAGYDPRQGAPFWERMRAATGGGKGSEFTSTHPSNETRIRNLTQWADDEAYPFYQRSPKAENEPLPAISGSGSTR